MIMAMDLFFCTVGVYNFFSLFVLLFFVGLFECEGPWWGKKPREEVLKIEKKSGPYRFITLQK